MRATQSRTEKEKEWKLGQDSSVHKIPETGQEDSYNYQS
jgi:hypothetical protein